MKRWQQGWLAAIVTSAALVVPAIAWAGPPDQDDAAEAKLKQAAKGEPRKKGGVDADKKADAKAGDKGDKASKDAAEDRALRGVVTIERGGQVLGLGAVLAGDGRILTALSPLGHGNDLEARFVDGTSVRVKLGHHDRMWDLALLVPQSGRFPDGLTASSRDPVRPDAAIRAFTVQKGKAASASMTLRSHRTLLGGDDKSLENAIEIGSRVSPTDLGSPVVDEDGRVVAVLGRGCAPNEGGRPCTPVAFGAPISAIKGFLRTVPASAVPPAPFLGIQGVGETSAVAKGVRVLVVAPDSPAEEAHLRGGDRSVSDTIVAVDGVPVTTPEALAEAIRSHGVGEKVPITVIGQGKYRQVTVLLRAAPDAKAAAPAAPAHPSELPALSDAPPTGAAPAPPRKAPRPPKPPAP